MVEAWQIAHRPVLYAVLRRLELTGWALREKTLSSWRARLRAITLIVFTGHETEICSECGRGVNCVWWCDDSALWGRVTGWSDGGGVCCPRCFERMAEGKGLFLRWHVGPLSPCTARPETADDPQDVVREGEPTHEERNIL